MIKSPFSILLSVSNPFTTFPNIEYLPSNAEDLFARKKNSVEEDDL